MYIMGVDGGGTKTYVVITDESGEIVGEGIAGGANHQTVGMPNALSEITKAINTALSKSNLNHEDIDFVQYGLAGADRPKDFKIINASLKTLPFKSWDVVCDTYEGLRIGSDRNIGVVLICGTGTNACGKNKKGETIQTGGFGYLYGDNSGGSQIAIEAFRRTIRSFELREIPTILTSKVPQYLGFDSVESLLNHYLDHDIHNIPAGLARVVHEAADEGDLVAIRIIQESGRELGLAALSVIKRLKLDEEPGPDIPIVLVGSILQKGRNKYLLDSLRSILDESLSSYHLVIPSLEPVFGSIMLAMDRLNIQVTEAMKRRFEKYGGYTT